jgi:hypothetical protein
MADKKISALTASTTPLAGTEVLPIVQGGATVKVSVANLTAGRTTNAFQYTSTVSEASQQAISCISANLNTVVTNGSYAGYSATNAPESTAAWIFLTVTSNGTDQIYQTCAIAGYVNGQTYKRFSADSGATWGSWVLISANTTGNIAFANGLGIDFSATPGTGSSELFADYEEGTFVATLTPNTSGSITLGSNNTLSYTRMGRVVVVNGLLEVASVSAPVGTNVQIATLPFTPASISPNAGRSGGAFLVSATSVGNITPGLIINGGTSIAYIIMTASTVQAGTSPYVQFTYITS